MNVCILRNHYANIKLSEKLPTFKQYRTFHIHKEASSENQLNDKQNIFPIKIFGAILNRNITTIRSPTHNALEFSWTWNLVHTYNRDVSIGKESWFLEDISNAKDFRIDFTSFRKARSARDGIRMCWRLKD